MSNAILIHSAHHETRLAIVEQGKVQELHLERHQQRGSVGNVYLGKVTRVLPGMQSAFIDIGTDRAAFLHVADVWQHQIRDSKSDPYKSADTLTPIEKLIFPGQTLVVQVLKDPLGTKGARLTSQISLAGRYLVLLPQDQHIGLSQKISQESQRVALRARLAQALPESFSFGLIARTQAEEASTEALARDIEQLSLSWAAIQRAASSQPAPAVLHRDLTMSERALRDFCNEQTTHITVDGAACYEQLRAFAEQTMPAVRSKIQLHQGEHPLFELAQVDQAINKALQRRADLPSGGYAVIDQTESMCTIDVNTGAFVGSKNFAETVLRTNLEAAHEIARQLRLRNLGGIILIDFIDMQSDAQREQVRAALATALARDPVRSHIHGFTALGLMELTRKRVRESLAHVMLEACACCVQTGQVKTAQTVGYEILREIETQAKQFDCTGFEVKASKAVLDWFEDGEHGDLLRTIEQSTQKKIQLSHQRPATLTAFTVLPL